MTTEVHDILVAAKAKIDTPEKWTQGEWALNSAGKCAIDGDEIVCFCAWGAAFQTADDLALSEELKWRAADALNEAVAPEFTSIIRFNDAPGRTHREVLDVFDKAIAAAAQKVAA